MPISCTTRRRRLRRSLAIRKKPLPRRKKRSTSSRKTRHRTNLQSGTRNRSSTARSKDRSPHKSRRRNSLIHDEVHRRLSTLRTGDGKLVLRGGDKVRHGESVGSQ